MTSSQQGAYLLGLLSAVLFSGASVIFASFSQSHSPLWMNLMKNLVALAAFSLASAASLLFGGESLAEVAPVSILALFASGVLALGLGDYFLFQGYQRLGSARTLMVFSLSPLLLTLEGLVIFGQGLNLGQGVAIFLMMACVWVISFEKFRSEGRWEWRGISFALLGVVLDNVGIVLSRHAFDTSPGLSSFTANAIRAVGSLIPLFLIQLASGEQVFRGFGRLERRTQGLVVFSALMGSFLSLSCWLTALKIGHIGSLAGVGSFNPVAASLWEWLLLRRRPSGYLVAALGLFLSGFFILLRSS